MTDEQVIEVMARAMYETKAGQSKPRQILAALRDAGFIVGRPDVFVPAGSTVSAAVDAYLVPVGGDS